MGAKHTQIAVSGAPLVSGVAYYTNGPYIGINKLYFLSKSAIDCADEACAGNPPWNFSTYSPKLIVINLGSNDANLNVPSSTFQSKYITFLQDLRAKHPNAEIFVMRTFNSSYLEEAKAAVNARISAGDTKVHFVDTSNWITPSTDTGDGLHPNDQAHQKIADLLAPILRPYLANASTTSVNDTLFTYDQTSSWPSGGQAGAFQGDNHWSKSTNAYYVVPFNGTQANLYGARAAWHGNAAVSIDGGDETTIDTYSATRADNVLLWSSPALKAGQHTLKVRVTGTKNASAWDSYVVADRIDIVNGEPNVLSNPSFESGLNGWQAWPAGSWQYADTTTPHSGTYHLTHRSSGAYKGATYTSLSGLSNGVYVAKAWVRGTGGQTMYIKDLQTQTILKETKLPASNTYTQVTLRDININNGKAEIGFWSDDPQGQAWLNVDDVTFYKQQ